MSAVEALAEVLREHQCRCGLLHPKRLAAVLVAAIRSMPAEQVAELIGGETERAEVDGKWGSPYLGLPDGTPLARVMTPWLPLGVSPETNGEQK